MLDLKQKELICVAIACYNRCEYCIVSHVYAALKQKSNQSGDYGSGDGVGAVGGGPSIAYLTVVVNECIEEFSEDF